MLGSLGAVSYDIISKDKTKTGLDSASAGAKKGESAVKSMSSTVQKHSVAIGGAMTGAGIAIIASSEAINSAYYDIQIGTGATGEALKDLKVTFDDVYGTIPASAEDISGAIAALNTHTAATGPILEEMTTKVLNVSRMMGENGVKNADLYGQALNQWGLTAEQGTEKMDFLFKVCQDTGIGFGELISQLNTYGPVLQNAGFTTEESAKLMGELNGAGISVSRVMPGLNKSFRDWAKEGKNSQKELKRLVKEIKNTEDSTEALNLASETFGAEGAQRLLVAIKQNAFELENLGDTTEVTANLINETADSTLLLTDKLKMMKDKAMATVAPFEGVGAALTAIGPVMMSLNMLMPIFAGIQSGTLIPSLIAHAVAAWAAVAPYLAIIAPIVAVVAILYVLEKKYGIVTKAVKMLTEGIKELTDWFRDKLAAAFDKVKPMLDKFGDKLLFLLGPIGAIIYAFKNWREILDLLWDKLDIFRNKLQSVRDGTETLSDSIHKLTDWLRNKLAVAHNIVKYAMDKFGDKLLFLLGPIGAVIYAFKNWREILDIVKDKLNSVIGYIEGLYDKFKNLGKKLIEYLVNGIKEKIEDVKNAFGDALDSAISHIKTFYGTFKNKGKDLIQNLIDGVKEKKENIKNTISDALNSASSTISDKNSIFREKGGTLIQNLINGMSGKLGGFKIRFGTDLNSIISFIGRWYSSFHRQGGNLIKWFINGVTGTLWKIKYKIGTELTSAFFYIGRWGESFYRQGRSLIKWFIIGVTGILWKIKYAIGAKLSETYYRVKDWFSSYYNLGKALIKSFINGFTSKIWELKSEITKLLWWIYNRLPHSPVKMGPLVEEPDWESYLIGPMRTAKISPSVMFESGIGSEVGASKPTIEVKVEATIYNYSDVEEMERMVAEATARGIHDAYGMR